MKKFISLIVIINLSINLYSQPFSGSRINCSHARCLSAQKSYINTSVGTTYDLVYHRMNWNIDPAVKYISGSVTSYFYPVSEGVRDISFDLSSHLTVDSVTKNKSKIDFNHIDDILSINLATSLVYDHLDSVTVYYKGVPVSGGFDAFVQSTHNNSPIIWTLSEPYGAKDWWPCKQNLNDKVDSIDVFVTTPVQYKVACNGLLMSEIVKNDDKITHWKHRHSIAAYLIAIAVTNYATYSDYVPMDDFNNDNKPDSLQVLNYVYPENLENTKSATKGIIPIIELFNKLFIPYPFKDEKYGHAEFGWGGGMEHQTMSFMGGFSHFLMAHELAHQWFGNYITCGSWQDIWLNEGFAVYLEGLTCEHGLSWQTWDQWKKSKIDNVVSRPYGSVWVDDTSSVSRIFDSRLTYAKGSMLLHMLRWELGDTAFFKAIQNYLNDPLLIHNYAHNQDLQKHLEIAGDTTLTEFFNDWYRGEGYPKYTILWKKENNKITITVDQNPSDSSVSLFEMHLPFKLVGDGCDSLIRVYNNKKSQTYIINSNFNVVNLVFDPNRWIVSSPEVVGILDPPYSKEIIRLSPNPVSDVLSVIATKAVRLDEIAIFDIKGQKVISSKEGNYKASYYIDVTGLQSGTYIIKFKPYDDNKYVGQQKFVKE